MPPHLALVPEPVPGPRRIALLGELRIGAGPVRPFTSDHVLDPRAGTARIGVVQELGAGLRVDLDAHGSVQADGALVVTVTLQVRHLDHLDAPRTGPALEAETTAVGEDRAVRFALVLIDGDGCRVSASGSIANGGSGAT